MNLKINPIVNGLEGEITAPGSKSYSHRAFISASLADGISIIKNPSLSGDVAVTINLLQSIGIRILKKSDNIYIVKRDKNAYISPKKSIDCKNSGTTVRLFSALSLLVKGGLTLTGDFFRLKRPILPLLNTLEQLAGFFNLKPDRLKNKRKKLICNKIKIHGAIRAQFISALLILCPSLKCENTDYIEIECISPLSSKPYINITLDVLETFGVSIQSNFETGRFYVTNEQTYRSQSFTIPGDFSSSSFILTAAALSPKPSSVIINNLNLKNYQADKKILEILKEMGANIEFDEEKERVILNSDIVNYPLKGIDIDCIEIPDLFPILSVIGAFAEGKTVLYNASNLRLKESDRISVMARELRNFGVKVIEEEDKLTIFHCDKLKGISINHNNDHRVAMACSIAALYAESSSSIKKSDIVEDSYPSFYEDLKQIGVELTPI